MLCLLLYLFVVVVRVLIRNAIHCMDKSESNQIIGYFDKTEVILLLTSSSIDKNHQFITSLNCWRGLSRILLLVISL